MSDTHFVRWTTLALAVVAFGCCLFNLFHGYHPTDDGFILSGAWRVFHGEVPFRDFIYVRPPLSQMLHSLWFRLPDRVVFSAARASFYLWMAIVLIFPLAQLLPLMVSELRGRLFVVAVALLSWLYAIHNFPPTPWHTIDGVLFSTLAVVCITRATLDIQSLQKWLLWGALFAGIAPLTKQNFALVPVWYFAICIVIQIGLTRAQTKIPWLALIAVLAAPGLAMFAYLASHGVWHMALEQIAGASTPGGLWRAGFEPYLRLQSAPLVLVCAGFGWFAYRNRSALWTLLPIVAIAVCFLEFSYRQNLVRSDPLFLGLLTWEAGFVIHWFYQTTSPLRLPVVILLSGAKLVAWVSCISWGYDFPILGFSLIGMSLATLSQLRPWSEADWRWARVVTPGLVLISVWSYLHCNFVYPYRDVVRTQQTRDLSELFPRFGWHLSTNEANYQRFQALKKASDQVTQRLPDLQPVVMPQFGLFYFLTNRVNPTPVDWWLGTDYTHHEESLIQQLHDPKLAFIIEMAGPGCQSPLTHDAVIDTVVSQASVEFEVQPFCVMRFH
jgi:hypothetical protein